MSEKMPDSTLPGVASSFFHPVSMNGDDFVELVWQNGQIHVQRGGSSSNRQKGSSSIGYSENPSYDRAYDDVCITKKAKPNTSCSLFPASNKNSTHQKSQQSNDHHCYQFDLPYARSKNSFDTHLMVEDEFAKFRAGKESKFSGGSAAHQLASFGNNELCSFSSCKCPASASFMIPRIPTPSPQKQDLRTAGKVIFPNFVKPREFFKSTNQGNRQTQQRDEEIKASKDYQKSVEVITNKAPDHSVANDSSTKVLHSLTQKHAAINSNQVPSVAECSREPLTDERSKAMGHNSAIRIHESHCQHYDHASSLAANRAAKGKPDTYLCGEQLVSSSSVCSLGASNDLTYLSRKQEVEDTYNSEYSSENDEEQEGLTEEEPPREGARGKRRRNGDISNLSEKKRRDKINKKIRALKELIPNCTKTDKASMLDDVIEHLKTLKLQLQIMSLGAGMCMSFMMLPAAANHLNTLHLTQFPQLGAGIGLRPSTGTPCNLPQIPPPQLGSTSLPAGITDNRLQIPGFPIQMLPMSIPHAPFIPLLGKPAFTQPVLQTSTPSNVVQHLASASVPTLKDSLPNKAELNAQPECPYVQYKQCSSSNQQTDHNEGFSLPSCQASSRPSVAPPKLSPDCDQSF